MKIRTQRTSAYVTRGSPRKLQFSKLTPKKFVESAHTKPRRSMIAICFGIHLSFISSMLCVHGLLILHNKHFESTLLSSNIRPILFEFCDPQCVHSIQYGTTLHFNTGKDQKDNAWVVGHARLFWITRELRTQISLNYSSARCRLNLVKKCDALSNNWPLMIGPNGKETNCFSQ